MSKRIVIMGATSGIGLHLAETYAAMGWRVGVAGRNEEVMKKLKEMFPEQIEWEPVDITRRDAPGHLLQLIRKLGGMDVYLHSAGIWIDNPDLDAEADVATVETNVIGFTRMMDIAYRFFSKISEKGGHGQIVALTSVAGTKGIGDMASYSASKRYQITYMQALEQHARQHGASIDFTDIRPGWTRTPLAKEGHEYPMSMSVQQLVPLIVKAVRRHPRVCVVDCRWAAAVFLWSLIPGCLWVKLPIKPY